ncbi:MAG: hypothetical protein ACI93G_002024 [Hyphomonas sp.]
MSKARRYKAGGYPVNSEATGWRTVLQPRVMPCHDY